RLGVRVGERLGLQGDLFALAPEPELEARPLKQPVLGVEIAILVCDRTRGLEAKARTLQGAPDLSGVLLLGDAEFQLPLQHALHGPPRSFPYVAAMSRRAAGCTSHSSVPCPAPGVDGNVTSAAPPFL